MKSRPYFFVAHSRIKNRCSCAPTGNGGRRGGFVSTAPALRVVHEPRDAGSNRLLRERLRALLMHRLESRAGFFDIGGNDVDDGVGARYSGGHRGMIAYVGAQDRDTFQIGRWKDAWRPIGRPNCDAQRRSFGSEPNARPSGQEIPCRRIR
jgi:hypothetical protein